MYLTALFFFFDWVLLPNTSNTERNFSLEKDILWSLKPSRRLEIHETGKFYLGTITKVADLPLF